MRMGGQNSTNAERPQYTGRERAGAEGLARLAGRPSGADGVDLCLQAVGQLQVLLSKVGRLGTAGGEESFGSLPRIVLQLVRSSLPTHRSFAIGAG